MADTEISQESRNSNVQYIRNFPFPSSPGFEEGKIISALDYSPLDDDIIMSSYPKTGGTWVQYIILQLLRGPEYLPSANEIFQVVAPCLEITGSSAAENLSSPRFVKFHVPYHLTPRSKRAKYICTFRNPKDLVVSYHKFLISLGLMFDSFDAFFDQFITGDLGYGDYFEHLLSWHPHKDDGNVMFVCYEELLGDTRKGILRIAEFLGEKYLQALKEDDGRLSKIVESTSFKNLKSNVAFTVPDAGNIFLQTGENVKEKTVNFFRKGVHGDWKNHLSEEQRRRLDARTIEKLSGTKFVEQFELWEVQQDS